MKKTMPGVASTQFNNPMGRKPMIKDNRLKHNKSAPKHRGNVKREVRYL